MKFLPFVILLGSLLFPANADHLLLTRVVTQPDAAESFSIYNPTDSPIDLTNYYICDDEEYYKMQTEGDMAPSSWIDGFTAQFPPISLDAYDTLTVVLHANYSDYYGESFSPDLVMYVDQNNSMIETEEGSFGVPVQGDDGNPVPKLNDDKELLILFFWDGNPSSPIHDVDYFIWLDPSEIDEDEIIHLNAINKTGISDYENDTPAGYQLYFETLAGQYYAYSRIGTDEVDEIQTGGNGINGHNETSENFRESWEISLLFNLGCTDDKKPNFDPMAEVDDDTCIEYTIEQIYNQFGSELSPAPCDEEWSYGPISTMGLIVDYQVTGGPKVITIEDENGYQLEVTIWDFDPMFSDKTRQFVDYYDPTEYIVLITGTLGIYNCNFQLDINSEDDITYFNSFHPFGDFVPDSSIVSAQIDPAPFVIIPTLGEHLDFRYSFPKNSRVIIRVFDISGRFITSIVDRYFEQAGQVNRLEKHAEWDGRDHLGQIVQPGTYIMHIETMNPVTGETQTDAAPIVVGVKN